MAEDAPARPPAPRDNSEGSSSSNSTVYGTGRRTESTNDSRGGIIRRAVGMTADRLGRSGSLGKAQLSQSQPTLPTQAPRRLLSLSNKAKGKEKAHTTDSAVHEGDTPAASTQTSTSLAPTLAAAYRRKQHTSTTGEEDSPFITPGSPPLGPSRPDLFRGFGSMRAGTQTLIQALQALPWIEDQDNDDDVVNHDITPTENESDEDDKHGNWLASSIHTIYRPLARSRRGDAQRRSRTSNLSTLSDNEDVPSSQEPEQETIMSEEEIGEDFEPTTPGPSELEPDTHARTLRKPLDTLPELEALDTSVSRGAQTRSGSMATVKLQRRARLAEKLRGVFELDDIHEVIAEMPCWLMRSVLLQGYIYLTDTYLCFFAHMPSKEDQVLKSGSLSKKAQRTKRWIRHWFVLKNDVLSWYQSSSDPYFPHGVVDLRYAITCEPVNDKGIRLRTNQKSIRLTADSVPSRDEWVKAIRRVMFKAQNMGDSVKIAIPYASIVDVDISSAMDFSETVEIKVVDQKEHSFDSYFFAYFNDLPGALEQIREAVRAQREGPGSLLTPHVIDTTTTRPSSQLVDRAQSLPATDSIPKSQSVFRLSSLLRPLQDSFPISRSSSAPEPETEEFTHVNKRGNSSFFAVTSSPKAIPQTTLSGRPGEVDVPDMALDASYHTYPPSPSRSPSSADLHTTPIATKEGTWSVAVPSWLRIPSRRMFSSPVATRPTAEHASMPPPDVGTVPVSEVLTSATSGSSRHGSGAGSGDYGFFSILEAPAAFLDADSVEKFHSAFAFDEKETLLGIFPGYIFRLLPVYGRLYISSNYFCFRSSGPLTSKTKMILPIRDILHSEKSKAFRFGHHGLVLIIKGHEELFFEFSDEDRRSAFIALLQRQKEEVQRRLSAGDTQDPSSATEALILEELGPRKQLSPSSEQSPQPASDAMSESLPAVMFTSNSSTFLTFKPKRPLHFTFLTIGSRGDVQPYIALGKGLLAEGHRVRIATHGEFKEWIESHGIEFGYVGGDPAELMRICVENGTFTVAFLKEGMQKFRGWIDDLLKTSWEACQNTDVLIESPSAMAGVHIAEALKIPYFRAFTMTWTRTRAYPHAFAVPEHKMGGNYNYMSYVLFDQVFWRGTAGQINRWRRNTLGLPGTSLDRMEPHKIPFLYNFSPTVVPPPLDWPEWIRITGYWFLDDADVGSKKWTPPADLQQFLDDSRAAGKKIVYIGFGSIVVSDPKAMTKCVIEAIVESGVHAILSKGWSDRLVKNAAEALVPEEPLPKCIYPVASIPHDWLFQKIDAACHHGGAGTTGASLRAGIPTIIRPFFGDQFFWADRVEALGIGSAVRKLTVENLKQALITATTDIKQIERARNVGEQIRSEDGVATAIEAIYRDLEYARSLVKGGPSDTHPDEHDAEHATIRDFDQHSTPERSRTRSQGSSVSSPRGAASDWSVISDQEDHHP
ncbi:glycosyltransferase family 1 protein [Gelatoporia subvermispora B]|uniref:sterol 3beta-glucosyltransferase n=1 Tax=Ceriporiopsis subvermispora (strain B) TaxID=914234 RepID=M2RB25_CERS8|nr:glycosyltransferase family 1 protein [Gelatoporia subvermispora B]